VIDLPEDRWVLGTPVRIVAEDETVDLAAIRSRARTQGQAFVGSLGITVPAHLLAANGDGAPDADGRALAFGLPFPASGEPVAVEYTLQLSTFVSTSTLTCNDWFGVPPRGFALSIENFGTAREVHRDAALPRSRGCPADYRISAVYAPFQAGDISGAVALVSVFIGGFEGRDRRFVAVPLAAAAGRF